VNWLVAFLNVYTIWGEDAFAFWLRSTAFKFAKVGAEFMLCFWLWTLSPLAMTFALPIIYVVSILVWRRIREANFDRRDAARRAIAIARIDAIFREN
jgi:hypothetical protein